MPVSLTPPEQHPPSRAQAGRLQKTSWVQSLLAIATGYLFLALGAIAIMGLLAVQGVADLTSTLLLVLTLVQLCLATAGSYITALLAPAQGAPHSVRRLLVTHGLGLATLVIFLWLISAVAGNGQEAWPIQFLNLATALLGISTGTWLRSRQIQLSS